MLAKIFSLFIARSLLHNLHLKIVLYRICRPRHILRRKLSYKKSVLGRTVLGGS